MNEPKRASTPTIVDHDAFARAAAAHPRSSNQFRAAKSATPHGLTITLDDQTAVDVEARRQRFSAAMLSLPPEYRLAIALRNMEHRSFTEMAEALRCSAAEARRHWLRALDRLGLELESTSSAP